VASASVRVCLYEKGLAGAFRTFVERAWPVHGGTTHVEDARSGGRRAAEESPAFLFVKDGEVIGHIATLPVRLWCWGETSRAYWVVGFMVLPEYRKGPVGPLIIKKVNETLDCAMTLHVEEAALRVFKGLGWAHIGVIPQYVRVLNAYRLLSSVRLGGLGFISAGVRPWSSALEWAIGRRAPRLILALLLSAVFGVRRVKAAFRRPELERTEVGEEAAFDDSYDALWEKVRDRYGAAVVRDRQHLEGQYGERVRGYRLLACRRRGELQGYCILKLRRFESDPRMGNTRLGTIVDCLFDPSSRGVLQLLIDAAADVCRRERVDALFCTASHAAVGRALSENGFVRIPGNLNFAIHDPGGRVPKDMSVDAWHVMRGDSDADENF
jgi:hypothetical protein